MTLSGRKARIAVAKNCQYYVDLKNAISGSNVRDVLWEAPQGIEIAEISPKQTDVVLINKDE